MKRLVVDLDGTLTIDDAAREYSEKAPNEELVSRLREYKELGFEIIIATARNMRTFDNSIGKINAHTLPVLIDWLRTHKIPYDEIHVGKPWCGNDGFYIDDKAIRPSEFLSKSYAELLEILKQEVRSR